MTPVRMMHPQHGWTHAYDQGEVERLKGFGWLIEEPPVELSKPEEPGPKRGRPRKVVE